MEKFSEETDLHGVKYMFDSKLVPVRRAVWALLCLGALAAFLVFFTERVEYFLSYPSTSTVKASGGSNRLPGVAVCLHRSVNWSHQFSDVQFVYLAARHLNMELTRLDSSNTTLTVSEEAVAYFSNLSSADKLHLVSTTYLSPRYFTDKGAALQITFGLDERDVGVSVLDRAGKLPLDLDLSQERVTSGIRGLGIMATQPSVTCRTNVFRSIGFDENICPTGGDSLIHVYPTVEPIFGSCLVFNLPDSTLGLKSSSFGSHKKFCIDVDFPKKPEYFLTFQPVSFVYDVYSPAHRLMFQNGVDLHFLPHTNELLGMERYTVLDKPFSDTGCVTDPREMSTCVTACVERAMPCHIIGVGVSGAAAGEVMLATPLCPLHTHHTAGAVAVASRCSADCRKPCTTTTYTFQPKVEIMREDDPSGEPNLTVIPEPPPDSVTLLLRASPQRMVQVFTEEEAYGVGSLLAEVGGTMGLFIGASVLTLGHAAEALYWGLVTAVQLVMGKRAPKPTRNM